MDLGDLLPQLEDLVNKIGERHIRDALLDIIETGRDMWRKSTMHIPSAAHWHDAAHTLSTHLTQLGDPQARLVSSHATFVSGEYLGKSARVHHAAVGTSLAALDRHTQTLTASAATMHQIGDHFDNAQEAQWILGLACGGLVLALGSAVLTGGADLEISLPGAGLACADGAAAAATIASELAGADVAIMGLALLATQLAEVDAPPVEVPTQSPPDLPNLGPIIELALRAIILVFLGGLAIKIGTIVESGSGPAPTPDPQPIPEDKDARTRRRDQRCGSAEDHVRWGALFGGSEPSTELDMMSKHPDYWCYILNELWDIFQAGPFLAGGELRLMHDLEQKGEKSPIDASERPSNAFMGAFFQMQWIHDHRSRMKSIEPIWNESKNPDGKTKQGQPGADAELTDGTIVEFKSVSNPDVNEIRKQIQKDKSMYPERPIHFVFNGNKLGKTPKIPPRLNDLFQPGQQPPVTYEIYTPTEDITSNGTMLPSYP